MSVPGGTTKQDMRADVRDDVLTRLRRDYAFGTKPRGDWLRGGKCPQCGHTELYVNAKEPWIVKCGRENRCGWNASTRELYPDAFGKFNERFPATTQDPNATADAYMSFVRGFDPLKIKGWYRQGHYSNPRASRDTATVVFDIAPGVYMERFVETVRAPNKDGELEDRKANFVGTWRGMAWAPPGLKITGEVWFVEGCLDAIADAMHGIPAAATLSSVNFPEEFLKTLDPKKVTLVWALDNDRAGRTYTRRHIEKARKMGFASRAALIPQPRDGKKKDWNDAHLAGEMTEEDIARYRYEGDLFLAPNAREKGILVWQRTQSTAFVVVHGTRTYWWNIEPAAFAKQLEEIKTTGGTDDEAGAEHAAAVKAARVEEIANCTVNFLYFQRNKATDESWYYARVDLPNGQSFNNTFSGGQIASGASFKERLLSIAPGAAYTGSTGHLNWIIKRHLDDIRTVDTVDFIGFSREHKAWVFPTQAVSLGKVYEINEQDFFEIGRTSIKSLNTSLPLVLGRRGDYDPKWIRLVYEAFGAKGIIAVAFFLGSFFAEQIREKHKSYPFLEIVGEAGAGKSTLIEFLWKLVGRADYEGFDPNKSTVAARSRIMSQVSNLPVCFIESDREDTAKTKQFDWDELKTAYNGRPSRATGVKNSGTDTKEPPFRGSILISQNNQVDASEAIMQRIVHTHHDCSGHTEASKAAADAMAAIAVEKVSWFLIAATMAEAQVMELFNARALDYEAQIKKGGEVRHMRLAKNHGQMMALVDALAALVDLPRDWRDETLCALRAAAVERQRAIGADHPQVDEFWEIVDFLGLDRLNHSRDARRIAINLPHLQRLAGQNSQPLPAMTDLKKLLRGCRSRPFVAVKNVNSGAEGFEGKIMKCWVFDDSERRA